MAPMRRRVSRRVVKSTFQECFEYDIPGFRSVEIKRPSVSVSRNRVNNVLNNKAKSKQELSYTVVKDSPNKNEPLTKKMKTGDEKTKDGVKKIVETKTTESSSKMQSSLANRRKVKSTFMGSDYKRFKAPLSSSKIKGKIALNKKVMPTKISSENKSSMVPDSDFESKTWQPVVHLEKISVDKTKLSKSFKSFDQNKVKTEKLHHAKQPCIESQDLATRLKNALKDPMAEKEDLNFEFSDDENSNTKLVEEVLKETRAIKARSSLSRKALQEPRDSVAPGKNNIKSSPVDNDRLSIRRTGSDSALEDWPESSSETSESPEFKDYAVDEVTTSSAMTDWASPHVSHILHWQKQFSSVTNDLKSSFDSLKSIIEEKNSLISTLKNKLDCYNENTCHKILERILLDYDKHDPKNPATVIVNSILDYPNSDC